MANSKHQILYVGMDLGTSRTAVAGSNGIRKSFATAVGYPKDIVSKKLLNGRHALFGDEAIKRQARGVSRKEGRDAIRGARATAHPNITRAQRRT